MEVRVRVSVLNVVSVTSIIISGHFFTCLIRLKRFFIVNKKLLLLTFLLNYRLLTLVLVYSCQCARMTLDVECFHDTTSSSAECWRLQHFHTHTHAN